MNEPLSAPAARKLLVTILETGRVELSGHAVQEMAADHVSLVDVYGVLRGGVVEPAEFERGSWRYRVRRARIYVVVTFRSETHTVVVTTWRKK
jgi:hypothetical protein